MDVTMRFNSAVAGGLTVVVLIVVGLAFGCGEDDPEEQQMTRMLSVDVSHEVVLPTSVVRVDLGGTDRMEAGTADVTVQGNLDDRDIDHSFEAPLERDGDVGRLYFELEADEKLWPMMEPGDVADFRGQMQVELVDVLGVVGEGEQDDLSWRFLSELAPQFEVEISETIYPAATEELDGSGVLRPDEGETVAVVEQGMVEAQGGHTLDLTGVELPVQWTGERLRGDLEFAPEAVGVHPGQLEADVRFENRFSDGTVLESQQESQRLNTEIGTTFIANISPQEASRGQLVELTGRGFVDGDSGAQHGMLLRFEGTVTPADAGQDPVHFEGTSADEILPFSITDDETVVQDVWYDVVDRELEGFGAVAGTFEGTITPVVYDEFGEVEGVEWQGEFEILPTLQKVYLKYLPSFSVALGQYGLMNVEHEIRDQILETVQRDYADFNVEFVDEEPDGFAEYATVELGGPDPTGGTTFGVDNTYEGQPKDTGNLHLDSYLGGIDRETGQELGTPYGGVFIESFIIFSPALYPEMGNTSERFDDIFSPFMPQLDGDEVLATEWPDGDRAGEIEKAIEVFGTVVANTVSHEIGHAMGMAFFEDDWENPDLNIFHNTDPGGYIMDAGSDRSFEQRAEIDGEGPMQFNEQNRAYLEEILPR